MQSIEPGGCAVVVGGAGGIGAALVALLLADQGFARVFALARRFETQTSSSERLVRVHVDVTDESTVREAAGQLAEPVRLVIVATGALQGGLIGQPEKTYRALDADALLESYRINAVGPALVAKHMIPRLAPRGRSVFAAISARVGSIGDNRAGGWHSYRASKAALNMLLRNLAIEVSRRTPETLCVGLHPGTVDTGLSRPFQRNVAEGKLFTPVQSAGYLINVIDHLRPQDSGSVLAWDGTSIAP